MWRLLLRNRRIIAYSMKQLHVLSKIAYVSTSIYILCSAEQCFGSWFLIPLVFILLCLLLPLFPLFLTDYLCVTLFYINTIWGVVMLTNVVKAAVRQVETSKISRTGLVSSQFCFAFAVRIRFSSTNWCWFLNTATPAQYKTERLRFNIPT